MAQHLFLSYKLSLAVASLVGLFFFTEVANGTISVKEAEKVCIDSEVCQNGGTCIEQDGKPVTCSCLNEYIGNYCEHINPCSLPKCYNGGTCKPILSEDSEPSFICFCVLGYTSTSCEVEAPEWAHLLNYYRTQAFHENACRENPCENDGKCHLDVSLDNYRCECATGFKGVNCTDIDHCSSDPCLNDATCISSLTGYSCECTEGFRGTHCETDIDECAENEQHCEHGASCQNLEGSFHCDCPREYAGERCEETFVPCNPDPCQNGGRCKVTRDFYHECDCSEGVFGRFCEINIDDCRPNNCQNGGTCVDGINSFTCRCTSEYQGVLCQDDRDECRNPSHCQNGAICENLEGSFTCLCSLGFTGRYCENNINDCRISSCLNGGTCVDLIAGFQCKCPPDREGDFCQYLSACASNPCHHISTCQTDQITLEARCLCADGYEGSDCSQDIDECVYEPCEEGTCYNTEGSFYCSCHTGFSGIYCDVDEDECRSDPCLNGGFCRNNPGYFECICMDGYSGYNCEIALNPCEETPCHNGFSGDFSEVNIDDCQPNNCQNGGTCVDGINSFTCRCTSEYQGDLCQDDRDECRNPSHCQNGAICENLEGSFHCLCSLGFTGRYCENNINDCQISSCLNGGTCVDLIAGFYCKCPPDREGDFCQFLSACDSSPCHHTSTCQTDQITLEAKCLCDDGFEGSDCSQDIEECVYEPCEEGTCHNTEGSFYCSCHSGFSGIYCDVDEDECRSDPCLNGGFCRNNPGYFECICMDGYTGTLCETNIDECASDPCQNGGTCIDRINYYRCDCQRGTQGVNCEVNTNECFSNPCANGATCEDLINGYICRYRLGYEGTLCQRDTNECDSNPCFNGAFQTRDIFDTQPSDAVVLVDEDHMIRCSTRNPKLTVQWYKDGSPLVFNNRIRKLWGRVHIRNIVETDEGVYKCVASDIRGNQGPSISAQVTVVPHGLNGPECGNVTSSEVKISNEEATRRPMGGGQAAVRGSAPWMARLFVRGRGHVCSGSLIDRRWVVTAAHCFRMGVTVTDLSIRLGDHSVLNTEQSESLILVEAVYEHRDFNPRTFDNDIALIKLLDPVGAYTDYIRPICLADRITDRALMTYGAHGRVNGWGRVAEYLTEVYTPFVRSNNCKRNFRQGEIPFTKNMFCAGYSLGGAGAYQGDSGGPYSIKDNSGRWYLTGLVSRGRIGPYGSYTRYSKYHGWIQKTINRDARNNLRS